jgi:hypothetical protein
MYDKLLFCLRIFQKSETINIFRSFLQDLRFYINYNSVVKYNFYI